MNNLKFYRIIVKIYRVKVVLRRKISIKRAGRDNPNYACIYPDYGNIAGRHPNSLTPPSTWTTPPGFGHGKISGIVAAGHPDYGRMVKWGPPSQKHLLQTSVSEHDFGQDFNRILAGFLAHKRMPFSVGTYVLSIFLSICEKNLAKKSQKHLANSKKLPTFASLKRRKPLK